MTNWFTYSPPLSVCLVLISQDSRTDGSRICIINVLTLRTHLVARISDINFALLCVSFATFAVEVAPAPPEPKQSPRRELTRCPVLLAFLRERADFPAATGRQFPLPCHPAI